MNIYPNTGVLGIIALDNCLAVSSTMERGKSSLFGTVNMFNLFNNPAAT